MRRWRWGVVLGSLAFHALLVLLFVLDLGREPAAAPPPAMSVWLERPPPPQPRRPASQGAARARSAVARVDAEASPSIALPAGPASPQSLEGAAAEAPAPDLRGLGNCRLATLDRLPAEARARCQEQLARSMEDGRAPRPNFDPTGRYVKDARPYLTRPPKDGCKPVGSVKQEPMGQTSATIGIGCAWSF